MGVLMADKVARDDQMAAMIRDLAQVVSDRFNRAGTLAVAYTVSLKSGELTIERHRDRGFLITTRDVSGDVRHEWVMSDPESWGVRL